MRRGKEVSHYPNLCELDDNLPKTSPYNPFETEAHLAFLRSWLRSDGASGYFPLLLVYHARRVDMCDLIDSPKIRSTECRVLWFEPCYGVDRRRGEGAACSCEPLLSFSKQSVDLLFGEIFIAGLHCVSRILAGR